LPQRALAAAVVAVELGVVLVLAAVVAFRVARDPGLAARAVRPVAEVD